MADGLDEFLKGLDGFGETGDDTPVDKTTVNDAYKAAFDAALRDREARVQKRETDVAAREAAVASRESSVAQKERALAQNKNRASHTPATLSDNDVKITVPPAVNTQATDKKSIFYYAGKGTNATKSAVGAVLGFGLGLVGKIVEPIYKKAIEVVGGGVKRVAIIVLTVYTLGTLVPAAWEARSDNELERTETPDGFERFMKHWVNNLTFGYVFGDKKIFERTESVPEVKDLEPEDKNKPQGSLLNSPLNIDDAPKITSDFNIANDNETYVLTAVDRWQLTSEENNKGLYYG